MARVAVNPRRDLDKPLVDVPDASRAVRFGLGAFRWYLVAIFALVTLGGILWTLLLVLGWS